MIYTALSQRAVIAVSGEDAQTFLQSLISNDIRKLKDGAIYAALLSPQGKYLHDFFLAAFGEKILIDCERARVDDLFQRLMLYRLRAKVVLEKMALGVVAAWDGQNPESRIQNPEIGFADPRLPDLGYRMIGDEKTIQQWCAAQNWQQADENAYDRMRLELGVPDGSRDLTIDKSFLLEAGFEDLHGVDFQKGCYVGQEVTARSKFRGQVRKFLYQVRGATGELPAPGTEVTLAGAPAGNLCSHVGNIGLAMLRIEQVEKAKTSGAALMSADQAVIASVPVWATPPL